MIPARGPQTVCLMQSLIGNHSAIFALQSFAMQSLLFCNLCYAIFAFCIQSAQKHYKTRVFCNILLKMLKNHWFSFVFASKVLKNFIKPVFFAIFFRKY